MRPMRSATLSLESATGPVTFSKSSTVKSRASYCSLQIPDQMLLENSKICVPLRNMKTLNVGIDSGDQDPPMAIDKSCHQLNEVGHGLKYHPSKRSGVQISLRTGDYDFKGSQTTKTICYRGNRCAQPIVIALHVRENGLTEREGMKRTNGRLTMQTASTPWNHPPSSASFLTLSSRP